MLTERFLRKNGRWVKLLTGLRPAEFWALFATIEQSYDEYERERRTRPNRKRGVGAGRRFSHPLLLRVLACLCYLRLHLTQELTAAWFGMHQCDISRDLRRLLPFLQRHLPAPVLTPLNEGKVNVSELAAALAEFLQHLLALMDATEQAIERPKDNQKQREYYSGKKKRHTIKTQIVVNELGEVAAMTPGAAGKTSDIEIARRSRVIDALPDDTRVFVDKGYVSLDKEVQPKPLPSGAVPAPQASEASSQSPVTERAPEAQESETIAQPRVTVHIPDKKPHGGELSAEQKERNKQIAKVRILVEHVIAQLKNWRILSERFRCALTIYTDVFRTIAGLLNFQKRARRQAAPA